MQLFNNPNIDFIARRKGAYILSGTLLIIGIISLIIHGGPNYGIDFKGGTSIALKIEKPTTVGDLRNYLSEGGLDNAEIKSFGAPGEFLIYIQQQRDASASQVAQDVKTSIASGLGLEAGESEAVVQELMVDTVGPRIGSELRKATLLAAGLALVFILLYIGWRFEFVFAAGAIAALFHDVMITIGIFSVLNIEISLKEFAAFLTIIGYSLNDTIVVYDRIRENLKVLRSEELGSIINRSINQCLSRTVVTSLTTFIVVLVLFLFGGEVIKGFAFAMLVGVVVGTYSSIFVASPLVLEWQKRHGGKGELKMAKKRK